MRVWLDFLVIFILVMGALLPTQDALACSCASASELEHYKQSDVSFVGTVKKIQESQTTYGPDEKYTRDLHVVTFQVHSILKGELTHTVQVQTSLPDGANCGVFFQNDTTYLVFAGITDDETLATSSCSGNRTVSSDYQPSYIQSIVLGSMPYYLILSWWMIPLIIIPVIVVVIFIKKRKSKTI